MIDREREIDIRSTNKTFVYVGNWRAKTPDQNGFGIFQYDEATAGLTFLKHAISEVSVGAVYINRKTNILYCANEQTNLPGKLGGGGQILAVRLDPESGDMTEISRQPSYGVDPTCIALDPAGKYMIVGHHVGFSPVTKISKDPYGKYHVHTEFDDTTTVLFPLREDGSIGDPCDVIKHIGHGSLRTQANPHIHSAVMSPGGELCAVCDKGSDRVYFFRIDYETERLVIVNDYKSISGSSPRYNCFHPTLPYWYMNNETTMLICAFRYHENGRLEHICTADAAPEGCVYDPNADAEHIIMPSDFRIHPSGEYIYDLIRGINTVSVFKVDQSTGAPEKIQSVVLGGKGLRCCDFSPDNRFLLVTAPFSSEIIISAVGNDGRLTPTGMKVSQPSPGTINFFRPM